MSENSLFEQIKLTQEPLAARMRPRNLDEYIGQDHIVGKGRLLRRAGQAPGRHRTPGWFPGSDAAPW